MSITSSNNLAVNNSLTVSGNTILGTNATSTLICNATASIVNGMSISGNINQTGSTTFSTGTGSISLNGDVIISTNKKLTTSTAQTTINSLLTRINGMASIMNGKELYFVDETYSNYLKILHDGTNGYFDYTGIVYFRKDGSVNVFSLNSDGTATFYNALNTGAINTTGNIYLPIGKSLYIGQSNYIRIHHSGAGSVIDYTDGLYFRNSGITSSLFFNNTSNQATFNYNLNTYGIINNTTELKNNSTLSQVGAATFTGTIQSNDDIRITTGKSLYCTDSTLTNYIRVVHDGTNSFIDYTGKFYFRKNGSVSDWIYKIDTDKQTYFYNKLNTTGIANTGDISTTENISCASISNTGAITNGGILTQNSTANINSDLNVSGIPTFSCNGSLPTATTGTSRGLGIYWNVASGGGTGETTYLNYAQSGGGGHSWYWANASTTPTHLMKLDGIKNLSLLNNISCASITCSGIIQGASINNTGSIYMDNASPIYLKSLTDTKNYIKYDSTYDGPQIGFLTGISLKCTDNDSIIFNASKTKANVNVDTSINGTINGTKYLTFKGYTYNNATYGTTLYYYNIYDGTEGSSSNVTMTIPENCYNIKLNTAFASSYPSNTVEGTKEIIMHKSYSGTWSYHTAFQFNSTTYHPTYSIASSVLTITFPTNTSLTGFIRWSNCVTIF